MDKPRDRDYRRLIVTDTFVADRDKVRAKAKAKVVALGDVERMKSLELVAKNPNRENSAFSDYWFLVLLEPKE